MTFPLLALILIRCCLSGELYFSGFTETMWSPGCLCCSPETVQQDAEKKVLEGVSHRPGQSCVQCSSKVCMYCIDGLHEAIMKTNKSKSVSSSDPSLAALCKMRMAAMNNHSFCTIGFCCSFSLSIPAEAHCTPQKLQLFSLSLADCGTNVPHECGLFWQNSEYVSSYLPHLQSTPDFPLLSLPISNAITCKPPFSSLISCFFIAV